jgi:hypothetical protein
MKIVILKLVPALVIKGSSQPFLVKTRLFNSESKLPSPEADTQVGASKADLD